MKHASLCAALGLGLLVNFTTAAQAASDLPKSASTTTPTAASAASAAPIVKIQNGWVRATVAGQKVAAAYMQLQALDDDMQLVGIKSAVAPVVQIHNMQMQGDVMHMFEIKRLDLPKGKQVELRPGGLHIMLMNLPQALSLGRTIVLELHFANGQSQNVQVPVLASAPTIANAGATEQPVQSQHHHH